MKYAHIILLFSIALLTSCCNEEEKPADYSKDLTDIAFNPQLYDLQVPENFPIFEQPDSNLLTVEGIELGRHLFYDPVLSKDSLMSCAGCHFQNNSFTDGRGVSPGVDEIFGTRSSMSLLNVGFFYTGLFWDGNINTLEEQALLPIEDPIELHTSWPEVVDKLQRIPSYQELFRKAFGMSDANEINKFHVAKALAQFERTIISSGESLYDRATTGRAVFSDKELDGHNIFFDEDEFLPDGQCFHCHAAPLFTDGTYLNNAITEATDWEDFPDLGRGGFTGIFTENGKFRVPTLRNIAKTAPYMHDGRFETLEEVMEHYNSGGHPSIGRSPFMDSISLTTYQTEAVIDFMHTLTDDVFLNDPRYSDPN